jgi:intergrase/recombinase
MNEQLQKLSDEKRNTYRLDKCVRAFIGVDMAEGLTTTEILGRVNDPFKEPKMAYDDVFSTVVKQVKYFDINEKNKFVLTPEGAAYLQGILASSVSESGS